MVGWSRRPPPGASCDRRRRTAATGVAASPAASSLLAHLAAARPLQYPGASGHFNLRPGTKELP